MAWFKQTLIAVTIFLGLTFGDHVDDYLGLQYYFYSSENFEAVLEALNVDEGIRGISVLFKPTVVLTKEGNAYTYDSEGMLYNVTETFTPDVPFIYVTADERIVTATVTVDGNTLHEVQVDENNQTATIDRTFSPDTLTMVIKAGNVVATRIHKRIKTEIL